MRRIIALLAVALLGLAGVPAHAAEIPASALTYLNYDRVGSITVNFVSQNPFDEETEYNLENFYVRLSRIDSFDLRTIDGWIAATHADAATSERTTVAEGRADGTTITFESLPVGVYVVEPGAENPRAFVSTVVTLPSYRDDNYVWAYDVIAVPKPLLGIPGVKPSEGAWPTFTNPEDPDSESPNGSGNGGSGGAGSDGSGGSGDGSASGSASDPTDAAGDSTDRALAWSLSPAGRLAMTGAAIMGAIALGTAFILAGLALIRGRRRRADSHRRTGHSGGPGSSGTKKIDTTRTEA